MSGDWTASVQRLNPATDVLVVKCHDRINQQQAHDIKARVQELLPGIRVMILDAGIETVVITKRRAKTLVRAQRAQRDRRMSRRRSLVCPCGHRSPRLWSMREPLRFVASRFDVGAA